VTNIGHAMETLRLVRCVFSIPARRLAAEAGVSEKELQRIERGTVAPQARTLTAIDEAFVRLIRQRVEEGAPDGGR
jgi:predicted transcriptional regulator